MRSAYLPFVEIFICVSLSVRPALCIGANLAYTGEASPQGFSSVRAAISLQQPAEMPDAPQVLVIILFLSVLGYLTYVSYMSSALFAREESASCLPKMNDI